MWAPLLLWNRPTEVLLFPSFHVPPKPDAPSDCISHRWQLDEEPLTSATRRSPAQARPDNDAELAEELQVGRPPSHNPPCSGANGLVPRRCLFAPECGGAAGSRGRRRPLVPRSPAMSSNP